jgi:hypothetical protein
VNQSTQRIIRNKIGLLNLAEELARERIQSMPDDGGVARYLLPVPFGKRRWRR